MTTTPIRPTPASQMVKSYSSTPNSPSRANTISYEEVWRSRRPFLESVGYEVWPPYNEDWSPSWIGTDINHSFCEDSIARHLRTSLLSSLFLFLRIVARSASTSRQSETTQTGIEVSSCTPDANLTRLLDTTTALSNVWVAALQIGASLLQSGSPLPTREPFHHHSTLSCVCPNG